MNIDELRSLSQSIVENPDKIYELDKEQLLELRKFTNPYGDIIPAKKSFINLSIINWKEEWMKKFLMTTMVGYLYRTLNEYKIEDRSLSDDEFFKSPNYESLTVKQRKEHDTRIKLGVKMEIETFLNRNFNYNPDKHIRGTHSFNKDDPERKTKEELIKEITSNSTANVEKKVKSKSDVTYKWLKDNVMEAYQVASSTVVALSSAIKTLKDENLSVDDKCGILQKKLSALTTLATDMGKIAKPMSSAETLSAVTVDPPADVFYHLNRYQNNHYEQLREVTTALYNEKPDIEYSVIYYEPFKNEDLAREHKIKHEGEFKAEVLTITNNGITLVGSFKENRERIDFYNKHTEILKRMMDQMETDHKLGKDLMEKQVRAQKAKNILESGPDAPGLRQYARDLGTVESLGAKQVLSEGEKDELANAKLGVEMAEVPDDAIQVDVFFTDKETSEMKKTKFYTQAEAPLHMEENSGFVDQYQPKRKSGEKLKQRIKTVVDRHGNKREIELPPKPDYIKEESKDLEDNIEG